MREARRREGKRGRLPERGVVSRDYHDYHSEKSAQDFFKDFEKWSTHAPFMRRGLEKECDHNMQEK